MVRQREAQTYRDIWELDAYGQHSPGAELVPLFVEMAGLTDKPCKGTALDAGCGSAKGSLALASAGFVVTAVDLVDARVPDAMGRAVPFYEACLWGDLRLVVGFQDYVYCTDVLEHIPPEFTMLVIQRLLDVARVGVFLHISNVPDQFGAFLGKPLHQTVQHFEWWKDHLRELCTVVEARDLIGSSVFYVRPQR